MSHTFWLFCPVFVSLFFTLLFSLEVSIEISSSSKILPSGVCSLMAPSNPFFISVTVVWSLAFLFASFIRLPSLCYIICLFSCVVPFSSVTQSCLTLCDPMNRSMPGLPVHHQLPEFTQTHVHRVGDAIQPSHSLSSPSPPALNLSQHQGLFQWVSSSYQVAKVLAFQLQHQSFRWTPRTDLI